MRQNTALRTLTTLILLGSLQTTAQMSPQMATPLRVGDGIAQPRKTLHVAPVYPPIAQSARVQGGVILEATIDARGHVQQARVLRSIPLLDQAAIDAVRQWEYTPTTLNGVPVPVLMTVTVNFTLTESGASSPMPPVPTGPSAPPTRYEPLPLPRAQPLPAPRDTPPAPVMPRPVVPPTRMPDGDTAQRVFDETMRTVEAEADNDPELRDALRNLRKMIAASGGEPAPMPSSRTGMERAAPKPGPAAGCPSSSYPVSALRWERFPIRVYIEEVDLTRRGYSEQRKAEIVRLIIEGLGSWASATGGRVGSVMHVTDFRGADLNIVFRNGTGNTIHDSVQGSVIRHATIMWDVDRWEAFTDKDHRIVNGMAHEMGHVLGIGPHPTTPGTLMVDGPEQLTFTGPQAADVSAMLAKYGICK